MMMMMMCHVSGVVFLFRCHAAASVSGPFSSSASAEYVLGQVLFLHCLKLQRCVVGQDDVDGF